MVDVLRLKRDVVSKNQDEEGQDRFTGPVMAQTARYSSG